MSDDGSRVGTDFGPYRLKRLLGRGGMGEVYEADHTVKEWTVAVKVMTAEFSKDPVFRERMKREARIAGKLQEPHVVPIHDYGEIDGQMFLEMRLVEGTDLDSLLKRYGPLTPPRAVAIISQIASALDAAHAAGVMHRDVKPPNILVTPDDFAYLVDFGIASATTDEKLTQLGTAVGTWKYMAPERFSNDEVTYRADIYSLACVLYEALTGSPPYRTDSASMVVTAHLMDPIPQPSLARAGIPKAFDAVVARGMAKKPEDRYASCGDLARAAREALSTPDRDHAEDILRRSFETTLPGTAVTPQAGGRPTFTPAPGAPLSQQGPQYADAHSSGPIPPPTQAAQPAWGPGSGGIPAPNQPGQSPQYYQGGAWGGTPPGVPTPPQQPGGPPAWNQPASSGGRSPWPIIAGAAALVFILILAGVGIWVFTRDDGSKQAHGNDVTSTAPTTGGVTSTRTAPSSPTTTAGGDAQSRLRSALPDGYSTGACKPYTPDPDTIWASAVTMVQCDQNSKPGGPSRALYGLFANLTALKEAFDSDISAVELSNCPGEGPSPLSWHYEKTPNVTAGQIACGTYKNHPNVIWSNDAKLVLSDVFGDPATLEDLHTWWAQWG
ncbi:serine/threonine protein kinase [Mycobacterium intermedium]|nr:serine/threonine-protein kinase [Mycobacterium intermedium]MCV6965331.1 serine/threonine protein kinase [Mycobacterium intermedium]ODQ98116.1 protein kinase [Mycobacterium intermedium]OPE47059.1 serine/threonine protein kinase [Mycobacterium intermedium]